MPRVWPRKLFPDSLPPDPSSALHPFVFESVVLSFPDPSVAPRPLYHPERLYDGSVNDSDTCIPGLPDSWFDTIQVMIVINCLVILSLTDSLSADSSPFVNAI